MHDTKDLHRVTKQSHPLLDSLVYLLQVCSRVGEIVLIGQLAKILTSASLAVANSAKLAGLGGNRFH